MNEQYLVLLFTIVLLLLLLVVLPLIVMLSKSHSSSRKLLVGLLMQQVAENQSLRNQLRAPDVATLNALQYATTPESHSNDFTDEYIPTSQEGAIYDAHMSSSDSFKVQDVDNDLNAAGWDPVVTRDDGGSPVSFERP